MSNPRARQKRSGKSIFERIAEATKGKSGAGRKRKESVRRTTPIIASKDSEVKGKRGPSKEAESILPRVTATKSGRTVKKSKAETPPKVKKKTETESPKVKKKSVSISASKTVTGKGGRDIKLPGTPMGGRKLANVTREQLEKLGLDPSKKSSLTKYLNAFDRLGKRPTKKSDLVAGKMMGGMMKRKGMAKGGAMKKKGYAMGGAIQSSSSELMNLLRKLDNDEDKKELMKLFGKKLPKAPKAGTMPSRLKEMIKVKAAAKKPRKMSKGGTLKKPGADQKGLKKLPTAVRNKMGYMAKGGMTKKGYAKGGMSMKKKGYASGGMMKKKGYSKGGSVRRGKPRGVGAATRGYGRAMKG